MIMLVSETTLNINTNMLLKDILELTGQSIHKDIQRIECKHSIFYALSILKTMLMSGIDKGDALDIFNRNIMTKSLTMLRYEEKYIVRSIASF